MTQLNSIISRTEFDNVVNRPDSPRTLPGHSYTNEAFFQAEVEHLFHKHWFPIAHEQMVPNPGDFYTIDLWDKKLVVVRGSDKLVRVLDRCCLEAGRDLFMNAFTQGHCEGYLGKLLGHRSWMYDLQGSLIAAPGLDESALQGRALHQYPLENWQGFLLVNLDGNAEPYSPSLATMHPWLKNYQLEELTLIREPIVFDMEANWKLVAENYIEAYHHIATHRDTFEKVSPGRDSSTDELKDNVIFLRMPIKSGFDDALGWTLPPIDTLEEGDLNTFAVFLNLPLFLLAPVHNSVAWLHLIPVSAEKSYWMIYTLSPGKYLQRKEDIQALMESGVAIHNEDMDACIGNQKGVRSRHYTQGYIHPNLEKSVWYFDRFILEALEKSDPRLIGD